MKFEKRPRCKDGSLDKRFRVNRAFDKYADIGDYYDPADPDQVIKRKTEFVDQAC